LEQFDYLADVWRGDTVVDEWRTFADRTAPVAVNVRNLAPRFGMTVSALHQAYYTKIRFALERAA
jgi:hypothetical protein